jgi:hypothetical protein
MICVTEGKTDRQTDRQERAKELLKEESFHFSAHPHPFASKILMMTYGVMTRIAKGSERAKRVRQGFPNPPST